MLALAAFLVLLMGCTNARVQNTDKGSAKKPVVAKIDQGKGNVWSDKQLPDVPAGSEQTSEVQAKQPDKKADKKIDQGPPRTQPGTKVVQVAKNVFLEVDGDQRRVLVKAEVCLRQGILEELLCKAGTKEHESILSAAVDAKDIHLALLAAGAEAGSPVKFDPQYTLSHGVVAKVVVEGKKPVLFGYSVYPAHGTVIKVSLQFEDKGKTVKVPAQQWLKNRKTKKDLHLDWVFAGSVHYKDEFNPKAPPVYAANQGDVICVRNMDAAMLDLPMATSADYYDTDFEAFTERIPPLGTEVVVILEPVLPAKKNK